MSSKSAICPNWAIIINGRKVRLRSREAFITPNGHQLINRFDFYAPG